MSSPALKLQASQYAVQMPQISNFADPSTTDLLAWSRYMENIAKGCDVTAAPSAPMNPYAAMGALQMLTEKMSGWLAARLADEERNVLLLDRLRHEERQALAHEELMTSDSDYADEYEGDEGDDE